MIKCLLAQYIKYCRNCSSYSGKWQIYKRKKLNLVDIYVYTYFEISKIYVSSLKYSYQNDGRCYIITNYEFCIEKPIGE